MLHSEAAHPNCAYMWMEHSLDPKVQGDVSAWFGTVPSVLAACDGNELLGPDGCANNGRDYFDQIRFWRTPTAKCEAHADQCVPYYRWVSDYVGVIGGR
jgi:putative spermidine/putrescine transport system substrate-binding protein